MLALVRCIVGFHELPETNLTFRHLPITVVFYLLESWRSISEHFLVYRMRIISLVVADEERCQMLFGNPNILYQDFPPRLAPLSTCPHVNNCET